MESIVGIVISVIMGAIGIYFTIKYSSVYHIRKRGRAKEKYKIVDCIELREKNKTIDLYRLVLDKSSIKNSMGFADFTTQNGMIVAKHYAFVNSCIHNIIAPGKILIKEEVASWVETAPSNKYPSLINLLAFYI